MRMVRAMCGAKLMEKMTEDLMEMLQLKETVFQMAKENGVRWFGHVLTRDDGHVLRKVLEFEVKGKRKQGRPKKICSYSECFYAIKSKKNVLRNYLQNQFKIN